MIDSMSVTAKQTVELFWKTQDAGDYTALVPLFADDAVVVDPFYGTFEGRDTGSIGFTTARLPPTAIT